MTATLIGVCMFVLAMHIIARIMLTVLASKKILFVSPKLGRIVAIERAKGKLSYYIGNLKGYGKHVDRSTGYVVPEEEYRWWDFLWNVYGVKFIGLDSVHEYDLEIKDVTTDTTSDKPTVTSVVKHAKSIHFQGYYYQELKKVAVGGNSEINLLIGINLETTHAGHSLKYKDPDWLARVLGQTSSFTRETFAPIPLSEVNIIRAEKDNSPTMKSFAKQMIDALNNSVEGNPSLKETVGQMIIGVNIINLDFVKNEVQEAVENTELNRQKAAAAVAEAEGRRQVAEKDADTITLRGTAENTMLAGKAQAVGGGDRLAAIERAISIGKLTGLQVLNEGGGNPPQPIILDGLRSKE